MDAQDVGGLWPDMLGARVTPWGATQVRSATVEVDNGIDNPYFSYGFSQ